MSKNFELPKPNPAREMSKVQTKKWKSTPSFAIENPITARANFKYNIPKFNQIICFAGSSYILGVNIENF